MNILVAYFLGTICGGLSAVVVCLLVKFYHKKLRSPIKSPPSEAFNPHEADGSNPYVTPFGLDVILDVEADGSNPYVTPFGLDVILEEESQEDMVQESELSPELTVMPPLPSYSFYGGDIGCEFRAFNPYEAEAKGSEGSNPYVTSFGLDVILDVEEESQEDMMQESELSPELTPMPPLSSYPFYGGEIGFEFSPHLSPELPPMTFGEMIGWAGFQ